MSSAITSENSTSDQVFRRCPACDQDNAQRPPLRYSQTPWELKRCARCRFVYLERAPSYAELGAGFAWEKTYAAEKTRRREGRRLRYAISDGYKHLKTAVRGGERTKEARLVARYVGQGNILDVGCGSGKVLRALPDSLVPFGVEISPALAQRSHEHCLTRGGYVVRDNASEGVGRFEPGFFDGVMMRAFLEHEIRPLPLLRQVHAALKEGGRALIKVPNYGCLNRRIIGGRWCGFRFPDHVNYFTSPLLREMVQRAGFSIVRFRLWDRSYGLNDNMWMVIGKRGDREKMRTLVPRVGSPQRERRRADPCRTHRASK